jgi:hypothetical protein
MPGALVCQDPERQAERQSRCSPTVFRESAAKIGLDRMKYGAHSLRAGMATEALEQGVNEVAIAQQNRAHKSLDTLRLSSIGRLCSGSSREPTREYD